MTKSRIIVAAAASLPILLAGCELSPKVSSQTGFRGTGMAQVVNPKLVAQQAAIPANAYETPDDSGPRASETYQNVQVLGNVSTERFNHLMANMNNWVAPQSGDANAVGCNYCHNPENMASDEKYTKVVARRMIQMTQGINAQWTNHVQQTGVTCWTCHRGNAIPVNRWSIDPKSSPMASIRGNKHGQNSPDRDVGYSSLPYDPFQHYLQAASGNEIRVAASTSHPTPGHVVSLKTAEQTYGLMMHVSTALGVNCTYCHNTQSFRAWNLSRAQRNTAYYGIRMVRDVNTQYIQSVANVLPADQKGPLGDPYKVNCATCHQGLSKPMNGVSMRGEAPTLWTNPPRTAATASR